jgi:hypothetical protein
MADGLKNLRSQGALFEVLNKLEEAGCDPIAAMAEMAVDKNVAIDIRVKLLRDLAQYVHPKRRSVEISNKDGEALVIKIKKFTEEDLAHSKFKESPDGQKET